MQIDDLVRAYRDKTDEELLSLIRQSEELTPGALAALKSEASRRRLDILDIAADKSNFPEGIEVNSARKAHDRETIAGFLAEVLRLYHSHLWLFLKGSVPAVAIGYGAILLSRDAMREITQNDLPGVASLRWTTQFELIALRFGGYLVSWIASSFLYSAICVWLQQFANGCRPLASSVLFRIRQRPIFFLTLSSLLFLLFVFATALASILWTGVVRVLWHRHVFVGLYSLTVGSFVFFGLGWLLVTRFALAIPAFVLDGYKIRRAIFRSDELTEGKWLILAVLLAKGTIGSYVAGMAPYWLARLAPTNLQWPSWSGWGLAALSIAGVAVVEPMMFIGFAALYLRESSRRSGQEAMQSARIPTSRKGREGWSNLPRS